MRKIIWFFGLLPLLYAAYRLSWGLEPLRFLSAFIYEHGGSFLGRFPNDPLKFAADLFGLSAIQFLIAALSVTPFRAYLKINLVKYRRLLGLWSFGYALMHSLFFFIVDNEGRFSMMLEDAYKRPFVFFGLFAFLILAMMALTSFKSLYARFVQWHKLVYVATVCIALHFMMSQKVIGLEVAVYVAILTGLLALRLLKR